MRGVLRGHAHGTSGPSVVVVHGGPGAPGSACGLARGLAAAFRVREPFQRGSAGPDGADTGEPLTVARHIADLHDLVAAYTEDTAGVRPALVGHSWGAMLALACAAAHPGLVAAVVAVCSGTFDPVARERFRAICDERMDRACSRRLAELETACPDPDLRLRRRAELLAPIYGYDEIHDGDDEAGEPCDARANKETWADMLRLQGAGVYPAAFAAIAAPVLIAHGAHDPHPGRLIRASLVPYIPELEYREWDRCGHYPWRERAVRDEFFAVLGAWLRQHMPNTP